MTTKTKKKPQIEVGQTLYVTQREMFRETTPNLREFEVTKVNTTSVYMKDINNERARDREIRFDKKTLSYNSGIGFRLIAYTTEKEYWDMIALKEERATLTHEIQKSLSGLDIEKLREIKELINS